MSGTMNMLSFQTDVVPIWIRFMRFTQNTTVVRLWRFTNNYQYGFYVAVVSVLEVDFVISRVVMRNGYC